MYSCDHIYLCMMYILMYDVSTHVMCIIRCECIDVCVNVYIKM